MTIKRCSKGSIPIVKRFLAKIFSLVKNVLKKMALIRGNGGLDIRFCVRDPEKAHPLAEPRVLAYFALKSAQGIWPYRVASTPPPKKNMFLVRKVTHAQKRYARADRDERLHRCRGPRRNHLCRFVWLSLSGFGRGGGSNFGLLHWLALSPL